jgi:hypothetical protein
MDKRLVLTIIVAVTASAGFVYMQEFQDSPERTVTTEGEMDVPDMKSRYIEVVSPGREAESPVKFRFDANTSEASRYSVIVDGQHTASGNLSRQNLERVELASGTHTYRIELYRNEEKIDETDQIEFSVVNGTYIQLISPEGELENGSQVEFVYSVNGSDTAELFLDGEKMAEDDTEELNRVTVEDVMPGEHVWRVEAGEASQQKEFSVSGQVQPARVHSFDVLESEEGWQARADVRTPVETQYTVFVDGEERESGEVSAGDSSLGIPLELSGEHSVYIRFRNEHGEVQTEEVNADAN